MSLELSSKGRTHSPVRLGIVVPCFNESEVLGETAARLIEILERMYKDGLISSQSSAFFVDDGSTDGTWKQITELAATQPRISGIKLSRNHGHQNALLSGLMISPGDVLISIDADLQDDLSIIPNMITLFTRGADVVYAVRRLRRTDGFFKRVTAEGYYKLLNSVGVDVVFNHADYRLMSRRALDALKQYGEVNLFLRGMVRLLGFKSAVVEYDRAKRYAGESKYPLIKMLAFAWQGISSFTITPLRFVTLIGLFISAVSLGFGFWALFLSVFTKAALPGWASTVVPMYFLGGVQLLSIGVLGEYIGKIYLEVKARPRFHVECVVGVSLEGKHSSDLKG